ncbi:MAG: biopolymer transporter ExbD [Chitinispirillaceae bacterium]|nr:biopolymer transporter ExbD [Chitinispirillaceae bacterium]
MSLSLFRSNRPPSDAAPPADIDVTPVMNMFIILIPFLVSMAVFTHLSIIEFSLPPNVNAGMNREDVKPKPKLTIRVGGDYIGIVLGEKLLDSLPVIGGNYPMDSLGVRIRMQRDEYDYSDEVIIASLDGVAFKQVVAVMDLCRDAGLEKIGLSSATEDPEGTP